MLVPDRTPGCAQRAEKEQESSGKCGLVGYA